MCRAGSCGVAARGLTNGRRRIRMRRTWTIIGVSDVQGSVAWYQSLLGLPQTAPAHDYFGQILDSDGTVLLCLHEWGAHEHPTLMSPEHAQPGLRRRDLHIDDRRRTGAGERRSVDIDHGVIAVAVQMDHDVAGREARGLRLQYLPDAEPHQRLAERQRTRVALRRSRVEAQPQRRIDGDPEIPDEDLALPRIREPAFDNAEVTDLDPSCRPRRQLDFTTDDRHRFPRFQ